MPAKLHELVSQEELKAIQDSVKRSAHAKFMMTGEEELQGLDVRQLSDMALILMRMEYKDYVPACFLSVEALRILHMRAKDRNIAIF